MDPVRNSPQRTGPPPPPAIIWAIAAILVGFEAAFQLGDVGVLFPDKTREKVYCLGAFWDLYWESWRDGQQVYNWQCAWEEQQGPIAMWTSFVTHAFLHGGLLHLIMNGVVFLSLGGMIAHVLGPLRFCLLYALTAISGALVFALIATTNGPLVGASGAIFGFFGALKAWEWRYLRARGGSYRRFWGTIIGLVAINVVLFFFFPGGGQLAWEAHLGGFIAGFVLAPILGPRIMGPSPI